MAAYTRLIPAPNDPHSYQPSPSDSILLNHPDPHVEANEKRSLDTLPSDILWIITTFLPWQEHFSFTFRVSKTLLAAHDFKELKSSWEQNPLIRQVYERFMPADDSQIRWLVLKTLLQRDLKTAQRMILYKQQNFSVLDSSPLRSQSQMLRSYFDEFRQICHLVSYPFFLQTGYECSCLRGWRFALPLSGGKFVDLFELFSQSCFTSCLGWSCLGAAKFFCGPVSPAICCIVGSGASLSPCFSALVRQEGRGRFMESLKRFEHVQEIISSDLSPKLEQARLLLSSETVNQDQFCDQLIEILEIVEVLLPTCLPLILHQDLERLSKKKSPLAVPRSLQLLSLLNRVRFLIRHLPSPLPLPAPEQHIVEGLQKMCSVLDAQAVRDLVLGHLIDVNSPSCLEPLFSAHGTSIVTPAQINVESFSINETLSIFVQAGLDIRSINLDRLTPYLLQQLLDAGICVETPEALRHLYKTGRFDLAFVLFLYNLEDPHDELLEDADGWFREEAFLVDYSGVVEARQQLLLASDRSRKGKSILCRELLRCFLQNNYIKDWPADISWNNATFQDVWEHIRIRNLSLMGARQAMWERQEAEERRRQRPTGLGVGRS